MVLMLARERLHPSDIILLLFFICFGNDLYTTDEHISDINHLFSHKVSVVYSTCEC